MPCRCSNTSPSRDSKLRISCCQRLKVGVQLSVFPDVGAAAGRVVEDIVYKMKASNLFWQGCLVRTHTCNNHIHNLTLVPAR